MRARLTLTSCSLLAAIFQVGSAGSLLAQSEMVPLELRPSEILYNFQSGRGVPISTSTNDFGSNGEAPVPGLDGNPVNPATAGQFQTFLAFGGVAAPATNSVDQLDPNQSLAANAAAIDHPRANNGITSVVLLRAQVGGAYLSPPISFLFASVIPVPETDEFGISLSTANTNVSPVRPVTLPEVYWLAEPNSSNNHVDAPYYWSPHAQKVYANQAGLISLTWRKATPVVGEPAGYSANTNDWFKDGDNYFRLNQETHIVSGSPVKQPRKMFWTERSFRSTGKAITVPSARVGGIVVAYNPQFPETVDNEIQIPGDVPITDPTNTLQEVRTLWFDAQQGQIFAYNRVGRVFMEILGDSLGGSRRQHLGFEVVEVEREPSPIDLTIELGDRLTAYASAQEGDDSSLFPEPLSSGINETFTYQHGIVGSEQFEYYAIRETANINDYQVHWMQEGEAGLRWPFRFVRYRQIWPADEARYSHYLRPFVTSDEEAQLTAVPLPAENAPVIEYQDAFDTPRAKLTADSRFYTFLDPAYPAHRTLLRFNSGGNVAFERVFSWLSVSLKNTNLADSVAVELDAWDPNTQDLDWASPSTSPQLINGTATVGQRISAPQDELGGDASEAYWAGHIRTDQGDSYNVAAYRDPFEVGFEEANGGAIIPVNAHPDGEVLEVWWYRENAAPGADGFQPIYWPSVISRYDLAWPTSSREIVLASNDGSGPLSSFEAPGTIYYQNDPFQPGYNPNEEHALVQGGQVWALRDDLNITDRAGYSSEPFVLLDYIAGDGRPATTAFRVVRERRDLGLTFSYQVEAGSILQPPMPLPLMEKPFGPRVIGSPPLSLNQEVYYRTVETNTADGQLTTAEAHHFRPYFQPLILQSTNLMTNVWLLVTEASFENRQMSGILTREKPYRLKRYSGTNPNPVTVNLFLKSVEGDELGPVTSTYEIVVSGTYRYSADGVLALTNGQEVVVAAPAVATNWITQVQAINTNAALPYIDLPLVSTQTVTRVDVKLQPEEVAQLAADDYDSISLLLAETGLLMVPADPPAAGEFQGWRLSTEPLARFVDVASVTDTNLQEFYSSFTLQDRKGNIWVYRGPHEEEEEPSMVMQFYYKTLPGFFFPTLALYGQPPEGTITPYLRSQESDGSYFGAPVYGNALDPVRGDTNALAIQYRPVWPAFAPVLQMAETLTEPKRGLPAVRGQSSLEVVYQQSQVTAQRLAQKSVVLHDPTRAKEFELGSPEGTDLLDERVRLPRIPDSIKTETYDGRTFFPLLPPHLAERFWFDPNIGPYGALVFLGEFVEEIVGDDYLQLNVLSPRDFETLKDLATLGPLENSWDVAITNLSTRMELFVESPAQPGTYVPNEGAAVVGPGETAAVIDDDVAVDSYALTAVGPGNGYVTLIAGNGLAFTSGGDPVSVQVMRISDTLYPGQLKIIDSSNPLSELLVMQQVVDLAGKTDDYEFQWKIGAPVDGVPPAVYQNTYSMLLGLATWDHVRFPLATDQPGAIHTVPGTRSTADVAGSAIAVSLVPFSAVSTNDGKLEFTGVAEPHGLVAGNALTIRGEVATNGTLEVIDFPATVAVGTTDSRIVADVGQAQFRPLQLRETILPGQAQSIVYHEFDIPPTNYSQLWLSLDLDDFLGARVYLNGEPVVVANLGGDDTPTLSAPVAFNALPRAYRLDPAVLNRDGTGITHRVAVELFSQAEAGTSQRFNLRLEAYKAVDVTGSGWLSLAEEKYADGIRAVLGEEADIQALTDNYLIMRYRATNETYSPGSQLWSRWTTPQLAEGYIKRILAGINPFNQRVTDLFANAVNTDVSLLTQAGARWEGDVALNLDAVNDAGLIAIYETVLRRGRGLSIDSGINYGPANDALLLVAGYLNDLYMIVGNEAWADASNPTIGIGTADQTYGDIATALFSFKGQVPSLLEEELALLRGRDDFLQPGVVLSPFYNRLPWNYTRGIDSGEVIYALNYNIQENPNATPDGIIDEADAARMFPQGHGDAYGHYLTAIKGYYSLILDDDFSWVPRSEAVIVAGVPVQVDYQDERKFATAAAALARTGRQVFDLTWRQDYQSGSDQGWDHLEQPLENTARGTTRYWALDQWACRTGQGAYINWLVGNAILPEIDLNPNHVGIQVIDRTTVPELKELVSVMKALQTDLDDAEAGVTPLNLPEDGIAFDIDPDAIVGTGDTKTHFEQVYDRALSALQNALAAFDDSKDVTQLLRSEQDSLNDIQNQVALQELAYKHELIELLGTPYADDIGPGRTYSTGYDGPDLVHYSYVETPELSVEGVLEPNEPAIFRIDTQDFPSYWANPDILLPNFNFLVPSESPDYTQFLEFEYGPQGFFGKPAHWTGSRRSPGSIQQAISDVLQARNHLYESLKDSTGAKTELDKAIQVFNSWVTTHNTVQGFEKEKLEADKLLRAAQGAWEIFERAQGDKEAVLKLTFEAKQESLPKVFIAGFSNGGDLTAPARGVTGFAKAGFSAILRAAELVAFSLLQNLEFQTETEALALDFEKIIPAEFSQEQREKVVELGNALRQVQLRLHTINQNLRSLDAAERQYQTLVARADRIQSEREIYRQRSSAVIQGFRTRDAGLRIFRNEKLERYKTLFDLAARYSLLAANAYDYETGLLHTEQGREFIHRIVRARALGVMVDGEPQFAGSNTGDPGLSSALAEMKADWDVLKGRLGFNNPDAYGTTVSLRTEHLRILPDESGLERWRDTLHAARKVNVLADADVRRYCMQIDPGDGSPVPGIVLEFNTVIASGLNLFGHELSAGDSTFSPSSFATKIFAAGVALEGYLGMNDPAANGSTGGTSPEDPPLWFLDPDALAATPYIYLVPVGVDSMRSPPLGDASVVRTWNVHDVTIPLPFNIGAAELSSGLFWQSADFLSEPLFGIRKHQAFRPVSSSSVFGFEVYGEAGTLLPSQYTNGRLVGRSVWNSQWKLVIPGNTLLGDADEGLDRFIRTVHDVRLHFVTYSYSGN